MEIHTTNSATQTDFDNTQMELREYFNYCNHHDNLKNKKYTWLAHDYGKLRYPYCHPARTQFTLSTRLNIHRNETQFKYNLSNL